MTTARLSTDERDSGAAPPGRLPGRFVGSVAFGTVLQPINSSMIAVALVSIQHDFHAGASVSWLVSALYLATAVSAPTAGRIADLFGARRVFFGGLGVITLASLAAPFAPNVGVLIATRVLLGIGTAAQFPAALTMVRTVADRIHARPGSALAALGVCGQTTAALGPTVGGLLVGWFDWQAIFLVNLPLAAIAFLAVLRWGPKDQPAGTSNPATKPGESRLSSLDLPGLLLFSATMTTLMFFLLSLAHHPQWWWLGVEAPLFALLILWERRPSVPFLDLRLFHNHALTATFGRTVLTYTAFYCIFYGLPQWLEQARGLGPTSAGLLILPVSGVGVASTLLANRLQRIHGPRIPLLIGSGFLLLGGLALTLPSSESPLLGLLAISAVLGLPNGFNSQGNQNAVYAVATPEQTGAASGLYRTSQYVGANIAAALLALVLGPTASSAGLHHLGLTVAALAAVLFVGALHSRTLRNTARN